MSANQSPLLFEYLKRYQEDPRSRIFAPLAELYRKAGLVDEAIEIAREGLQHHPQFVGGRVALARALFDQKRYEEVIEELSAVVRDVPDNLVAQRLLGESLLVQGRSEEALDAFKTLLYFNPQDTDVARMVKELEERAYESGRLVLRNDPPSVSPDSFQVGSAAGAIAADPDGLRSQRIQRIEHLQGLLTRIERYRWLTGVTSSGTHAK